MATPREQTCNAIVLRTIRYGESDVIAHLLTREHGNIGVIAKGGRSARSKLGVRLEPAIVVEVVIRAGRGDLGIVSSIHLVRSFEHIRSSWEHQQAIAPILGMLARFDGDLPDSAAVWNLTWRLLDALDDVQSAPEVRTALLRAWELKLLHLVGAAPQLGVCVRCGDTSQLVGFSAEDGGVVCASCTTGSDRELTAAGHDTAVQLLQQPIADTARGAPVSEAVSAIVRDVITKPLLMQTLGVAPDPPRPARSTTRS